MIENVKAIKIHLHIFLILLFLSNTPLIYALTFAEAGETWNSFSNINLGNLRRSVGFGIRIDVPYLGIIGIDYAYGFDYFDPYNGTERGRWQFHIIIGELFK